MEAQATPKLIKIRELMTEKSLDAYLVFHNDAHSVIMRLIFFFSQSTSHLVMKELPLYQVLLEAMVCA